MDLQARKLQFIREILRLKSEEVINKLEELLYREREKEISKEIKPFTIDEFNEKIDRAEMDFKKKRIYNYDDVNKEIESWS